MAAVTGFEATKPCDERPDEVGEQRRLRVELELGSRCPHRDQRQVAAIRFTDVVVDGRFRVAAPDAGEELDAGVVERPAQREGGGGGVELGHPGDPGVDLVEQQVDAGVGHGVEREVLRQLSLGAQLPEAVHEVGKRRRRRRLAVDNRVDRLGHTVFHRVVHDDERRRPPPLLDDRCRSRCRLTTAIGPASSRPPSSGTPT
ncbi:MAG: hypothetical protein R2710_08215 [Acidimicrobiales bacterium]